MDHETAEDIKRHLELTVAGLRADLKGDIKEVRDEIRDVKRHTDVVVESLRSDIRLVAEGVAGSDQKFTLEFAAVRTELREQVGDVKALIRAGYVDLDRRVTTIERKQT